MRSNVRICRYKGMASEPAHAAPGLPNGRPDQVHQPRPVVPSRSSRTLHARESPPQRDYPQRPYNQPDVVERLAESPAYDMRKRHRCPRPNEL